MSDPPNDETGTEPLAVAVSGSLLLLRRAAETGKAVPPAVTATVIEARRALAADRLGADLEGRFWDAYGRLSILVAPATAESLAASARFGKSRWFALAGVVMLLLIALQTFDLVGANLIQQLDIQTKSLEAALSEQARLKDTQLRLEMATAQLQLQALRRSGSPAGTDGAGSNGADAAPAGPVPLDDSLQRRLETTGFRVQGLSDAVHNWNCVWRLAFLSGSCATRQFDPDVAVRDEQAARSALRAIELYGLPLLYGLLGACVHVLRSLGEQIDERTYTPSTGAGYRIRLVLGAVFGPMVGLFISNAGEGISGIGSLSPYALAFLAGYGIELLFAVFDRLIRSGRASLQGDTERQKARQAGEAYERARRGDGGEAPSAEGEETEQAPAGPPAVAISGSRPRSA